MRERRYSARVLLDENGDAARLYGVRATPTVFLIGRDGTMLGTAVGERVWARREGRTLLDALLGAGVSATR